MAKKYNGPRAEYSYEKLVEAYFDCRKHKSATAQAIEFDFDRERNLRQLHEEIITHTYEIGKSICFIVKEPKFREVWAGSFRDRVVHHLIYKAIYDRFASRFIFDTYSCIPKRGTLMGAKRAEKFARNVSQNYSQDAYFIKMDIKSYFVNIDKNILYNIILDYVDEPWLLELIEKVIFHDPRNNVHMKSPQWLRDKLPTYKSLFNIDASKGLPIGNLTSQFFSNIYLNELDQYAKRVLKCKHYCRYVDDILIIGKDPGFLNYAYAKINRFLIDNLGLELNHKKKNINHVIRGFDFVGHVIKPNHIHLRRKTVNKCLQAIKKWKQNENRYDKEVLNKFKDTMNSYFGLLRHVNGFKLRKKLGDEISNLFITVDDKYTKLLVPPVTRSECAKAYSV